MSITTGGRRTIDLNSDRTRESDYRLLRLPASVTSLSIERADTDVKFHFQAPENVGLSAFNYDAFELGEGVTEVYLEHADGGDGAKLEVAFSAGVSPNVGTNVPPGQDSETIITNSDTEQALNVRDLSGEYQYVTRYSSTVANTEIRFETTDGIQTFSYLASGTQTVEFRYPVRVPTNGTIYVDPNNPNSHNHTILYTYY